MKGITRSHVAGALKLLNAMGVGGRKDALKKMLLAEHSAKETEKALTDIEGYPEWAAGAALETAAPVAPSVDAPVAAPRKTPKGKKK